MTTLLWGDTPGAWNSRTARMLAVFAAIIVCAGPATRFSTGSPLIGSSARQLSSIAAVASAQPHPAVCRIIAPEGNAVAYGSGSLVETRGEYGLVVTNWHVVRDSAGNVEVEFPGGFRSAARVAKVDHDWDLAALLIWRPPIEPITIAEDAPRPGDTLTIAGYGSGQYRAVTGRCTQYVAPGMNLPFEMVEVSVQARQGDSGGPILNNRGELAGVLFGAARGTTSGSYAGRVRGFLAPVSQQIAQLANEAHDAAAEKPTTTPWPSVATAEPVPDKPTADILPASDPAPKAAAVSIEPMETDGPDRLVSVTWQDIAGPTIFEQAKTVLAVIGALALIMQALRWMN